MSDVGLVLTLSFFALVFFFLSTQMNIAMCKDMVTTYNETLDSTDWVSNFKAYYGILTFSGCKYDASTKWFQYLIVTPILIGLAYAFIRLIKGGG